MEIGGAYPMLYAVFDPAGRICRDAVPRKISARGGIGSIRRPPARAADLITPKGIASAKRLAAEPGPLLA